MRISVIIPCHNGRAWIQRALNSVNAQTRPADEIIVINDNSSDDSAEQIKATGLDLTLLETAFGNAAAARNRGIEHATGDWLAFLDADDYWYEQHLEKAAELIDDAQVAYYSLLDKHYADGAVGTVTNPWPIEQPTRYLTHQRCIALWNINQSFALITTLMHRQRVIDVNGFDADRVRRHDMDLWLRVIHGQSWAYRPECTAARSYENPNSISRENWAESTIYRLRALTKNAEWYDSGGYRRLMQSAARSALSIGLLWGTPSQRKQINELAQPWLKCQHRVIFAMGKCCPPIYRWLHQWLRQVRGH